ncbi:MAG: type II secretion system major pseudopilin GspG [Planctomycetota bacterium]|nr:type II secretion system major pseudopilin GspG [Planctomycetota bacterium]
MMSLTTPRQHGPRQVSGQRTRLARAASSRRRGFTLAEVMIVVGIVLALSGLIAFAAFGRNKEAKAKLAETDLNNLRSAMRMFQVDFDRWPTDEEGIRVLWDKTALTSEEDQAKWKGYLEDPMPNDRWGRPWVYRAVGETDETKFELSSIGEDGIPDNEDDIRSWRTEEEQAEAGASGGSTPPAGGN